MNTYESKRQNRIDRLEHAAARARGQAELLGKKADQKTARMAYETRKAADELQRRAEAAKNNTAIFSDDPNASEKLEDKIARFQKRHEKMVTANKLVRKNDREGLLNMGFSESEVEALFVPDFCGRVGFPDYMIKNHSSNIARLKKRLTVIESQKEDTTTEKEINGVKVIDNVEENRLQLFFAEKPAQNIIAALKHHGFRWSTYNGCWQTFRSNAATYKANYILSML